MNSTLKGIVVGALALAGVATTVAETQAMPIQPLAPAASGSPVEQVYYYGYGYRRPFVRRFGYYGGYRRFGYYGYRRPFLGYRRPFYGYGYRRF